MNSPEYGPINQNWEIKPLAEVCQPSGIQTGPFGSQLHQKDYQLEGTPIITVEHLGDNRISHIDVPRVSDSDRDRLSRYIMHEGDIIFSRVGSVDRRSIVRHDEDGWLFSGRCLRVRPDPNRIHPEYLSWFFGYEMFKDYIRRIAVGATMPSLNTELLSNVPIIIPPLPEQRSIAEVLGALDDKIELNRRMNKTLEETAQALFKEWFVDNPEAEGWETKTIGEVVNIVGGSTPSTKNPKFWIDGDIHWATPKDLASLHSPFLLDTDRKITKNGLQQISSGLLPKGVVLLSSRAPIGYLAISQVPVAINQGFIALICSEDLPNYFILNWLNINHDVIVGRANGTTFLEISKSNFRPIPIKIPPKWLLDKFISLVNPLYEKEILNLTEIQTLIELRDTLLPRLMRGDVRVKDLA